MKTARRPASDAVRLRRALARLHRPVIRGGAEACAECSGWDGHRCRGLLTPWPCPTAEAARLDLVRRTTTHTLEEIQP
ncbi:hypothetical protein [Streptomyces sp. NPDC051173]|uniref:hypothetical protein n=1 Tax=Streptomyces sp. NPDC051173 TaxID=3155164 RepID=UPI00344B8FCD